MKAYELIKMIHGIEYVQICLKFKCVFKGDPYDAPFCWLDLDVEHVEVTDDGTFIIYAREE